VTAGELGDPVAFGVLVKAGDRRVHETDSVTRLSSSITVSR
jgi:hypothetical protein